MLHIYYHAPDTTMGATPPDACNDYRAWAHKVLCARFPQAMVHVDDAPALDAAWTNDPAMQDLVTVFCAGLWDACLWDWQPKKDPDAATFREKCALRG